MYGAYLTQLGNFIVAKYGVDVWQSVRDDCGCRHKIYMPNETYPDEEMIGLLEALAARTGSTKDMLMEHLGEFMVPDMVKIYGSLLDPSWKTLELMENLETLIDRVNAAHTVSEHPRFLCKRTGANAIMVTYGSPRKMCALAKGMIRGFSAHFGEQAQVGELSCMMNGDPVCTLTIMTAPSSSTEVTEQPSAASIQR